jgi:S1-C subfamily serine protease
MLVRILLVALILTVGCANAPSPSTIARVKRAVVSITYQKGENTGVCTGFFVAQGQVLTAEHCLPAEAENPRINILFSVKVLRRNAELVLIETNLPTPGILSFGKLPKVGESASTLGFAYGGPMLVYMRTIAGHLDTMLILDGPLSGGMSGGPVVNKKGEVVALNQGTNPVIGLATTSEEIIDFLK